MYRVGILLDDLTSSVYLYDTVDRLSQNREIEVIFLVNSSVKRKAARGIFLARNPIKFTHSLVFWLITQVERLVFRKSKGVSDLFAKRDLASVEVSDIINLTPIFSKTGLFVQYSVEDLDLIRSRNIDLLVRGNASGIFKGGILTCSRYGIISFHHGDNAWNRGGPPAFWEVFYRKDSTGFIVQILNEDLDGGIVVSSGAFQTKRTYIENLASLFRESNQFFVDSILKVLSNGVSSSSASNSMYCGRILKKPTLTYSLLYIFKTLKYFSMLVFKSKVLLRKKRWYVGFCNSDWSQVKLYKATEIKNPDRGFFADPFIFAKNDRQICFVEEFEDEYYKGKISAIEIYSHGNYKYLGEVLNEPFHLSFPFIFNYKGESYLLPESSENNTISLYRFKRFPDKVEFVKNILENVNAVDTMVFEYSGKWWMFTNMCVDGCQDYTNLYIYYSESPVNGIWKSHAKNPVCTNSLFGRNAGIVNDKDGNIYRVRQKQGFGQYGKGFSVAKIINLTCDEYLESLTIDMNPEFQEGVLGTHHMSSKGSFTCFDYLKF